MNKRMINRLIGFGVVQHRRGFHHGALVFTFALISLVATMEAKADPVVSQMIGVSQSIRNEFGELLKGTDPFAHEFGIMPVTGDLVQILKTTDNTIYPPGRDGSPDPRNVLIATTRVGSGVSPAWNRSGKFSSVLAPRPAGNTRLFVRVFNAPSREEASFYGDSRIFTVSSSENSKFMVDVAATDTPLDPEDSDGDGLNNSWERSIGSDPGMADSDGDGVSDHEEYIAGTDPLSEDSTRPGIVNMRLAGPGLIALEWSPSVKDRTYRIYHTAGGPDQLHGVDVVATLRTTGTENASIIDQSALSGNGTFWFRVSR